jgi:hypothetical protein
MNEFLIRAHRFLVGDSTESDSYWLTRHWIVRGLGFIYLVAFAIIFFQGEALWSNEGLLPITDLVNRLRQRSGFSSWELFWEWPSLFYFLNADSWIRLFSFLGVVGGISLLLGYANFFILLALWILQMSFVNSGQLFYSYGWETQLVEFTFLCLFLVPLFNPKLKTSNFPPPRITIWAMRWMLFRLIFGAGMIKIRGDECWRDLTCLIYHYETQPNPHPLSYFFHQLPPLFHYIGTLFNHFVELIVPFFAFGPTRLRRVAGVVMILFQVTLILSGNLAWLNWLTLLMCIPCFDDQFLRRLGLNWRSLQKNVGSLSFKDLAIRTSVLLPFALVILILSWSPALNLLAADQAMNTSYDQWHLVNSYGAFGSIGKRRFEVVIKGTQDETITEHTVWKEYEFFCAPGDVTRRPCWITPYHYHLDWQIWFSGMRPELQEEWLFRLVVRLLENNKLIGDLFAEKPFGVQPPKYIKMDLYHYEFAKWQNWPAVWWERKLVKEYMPPISLQTPMAQKYLLTK